MSVYFHGSFGLNRKQLAGILKAGLSNSKITDAQLAKPYGYHAPFAARQRAWLYRTGIAKLRLPIKLTEFGQVIMELDPGLKSEVTQWFMHHELTTDLERSETWHFFIKKFLPKHPTFTKDDLFMGLVKQLSPHSETHFGMMSSMNKVIVRKLIECYTSEDALGSLGFVTKDGDSFVANSPKEVGPWASPSKLAQALK